MRESARAGVLAVSIAAIVGIGAMFLIRALWPAGALVEARDVQASRPAPGETGTPLSEELSNGNDKPASPAIGSVNTSRSTIRGTVRHFDGKPADNCAVLLSARDESGRYRESSRVATGSDGSYSLDVVRLAVVVVEITFAEITQSQYIKLTDLTDSSVVDFVLPEPWYLLVTVEDETGRPIPGSEVKIDSFIRRKVGPDGLARICVERSRQWICAEAPTSEDHGWLSSGVLIQPPETHAHITLKKLGVVSGTLLAPDGQPLAEGRVCLDLDNDQFYRTVTDSLGRFRMLAEFERSHTLRTANAPDEPEVEDAYGRRRSLIGRIDDVHAGDQGLMLQTRWMSWDRELKVCILSPEGETLRRMQVGLLPEVDGYCNLGREEEGADGMVRFSQLPETAFRLWVSAGDGDPSRADWLEPEMEHIIPDGQEIVMRFRRGRWIQGRVFLSDGSPAKEVGVWAGGSHGRAGYARTDGDGNFRVLIDPLRPSPFRVEAGFEASGLWQSGFIDCVEGGQQGIRIQISNSE